MITAGEILNGGFRLLARHPLAVLVWALIHAAIGLASLLLILPRMAAMMQTMSTLDPNGSPQAMQAAMAQSMGGLQGLSWLMSLGGYFVGAVLLCAAFRAVLRPGEVGFAFLRIGWDEMRMLGMMLIVWIGGTIAVVLFILLVALVGALMGFLLRDVPAVAAIVIVLLVLGSIAALIYVMVRLTMMFPLTFIRRELTVDQAWSLTRGRFWSLFLPYLAIMLITSFVTSIVMFPLIWPMMNDFIAHVPQMPHTGNSDPEQARQAGQAVAALFQHMAGQTWTWGALVVAASAINGISLALYGGAMATAARGFLAADGKLPEDISPGDAGDN